MSVPEFDDTGETRLLMMMIAHVVVTERTGQNMLESVPYSIKGFFDSALKSGYSPWLFLNAEHYLA